MRVVCKSFEDFLFNLNDIKPEQLVEKTLRVSISEMDENGDGVKFRINFQASAIVQFATQPGEFLLEFGADTGCDIRDADPHSQGTDRARHYQTMLKELCETRGWAFLPGIIMI